MRTSRLSIALVALLAVALAVPAVGQAQKAPTAADVKRGLQGIVNASEGPPGAIATLYRDGRLTVVRAGRSDIKRKGAPKANQHMRIASVAKAFSGALALQLVQYGRFGLDDTIGKLVPSLPAAWAPVTVRQLLNHTSGLPDYTTSKGFATQLQTKPGAFVSANTIIGWVRNDPLAFPPGSKYEYSNTDNIVVGLIAEAATGAPYGDLLKELVFGPARLGQTSLPIVTALPRPFIHGYLVAPGEEDEDVSTFINPSGAWASGGIVSTPANLNRFIRSYLGLKFFNAAQQQEQMKFVRGGQSSPPGPGRNSAGLALFRYQSRCGTVYGHTGNFPGYTQFAAATADGSRAVTTTLSIPAPEGRLLKRLRRVQATAVCALLK